MNKNLHVYYFILILICSVTVASAQKITVNNSGSLEDLILNNLINGCVEVTNITSSINGSSYGFSSYGQFNSGSSNFPFENGIMLSTGNALSAGNTVITSTLGEGSTTWGSDPDLEAALGLTNTLNATSIEFDIISTTNQLQFNYLLASEEYEGINSCQFSDGFAFLIKPTGSATTYQNIALIPNTTIPVNTGTIHPQLGPNCPAANEQYFDGYNIGDTNYEGRTTVLTASATLTPNVQYHVKLVIADNSDQNYDSAVFIEGDSFNILDLGEDIATCSSSALLDADIQNPSATYKWFLDNNEILGQTDPTYMAVQSGTYRVEVSVPLGSNTCVEEDEIVVTLNTEESINPISTFELCDDASGDGIETFDLSNKNTDIENNIPISFTNYTYSYHFSEVDARSNTGNIVTPIQNTASPQPIYVRIEDTDTGCLGYTTFNLVVNPIPDIIAPTTLSACDSDTSPDGSTIIDLTEKDDEITGGNNNLMVSYHYNQLDANFGNNPISTFINSAQDDTVYVRVYNTQTGCINTTTLDIHVEVSPEVNTDIQYLDACDTDMDGFATFDLTEALDDILNGLNGVTPTFHETFSDAESGTNPITNSTNYTNILQNTQDVYVRIQDNNTGCFTIVTLQIHTNLLLTGTDVGDFALCDYEGSGGIVGFPLDAVQIQIANELPNITVTFFESENDRDNNNPITDPIYYVSNTSPKTLYIKINNGECEVVEDIRLLVNPILLFEPIAPLTYCDNDADVTDNTATVDLSYFDDIITNGNTDFTVNYFSSKNNADTNIDPLAPFHSVTGTETIWVRISSVITKVPCTTVSSFDIEVVQAPETTTPYPILICDDDQDGFYIINLEDTIPEVVTDTTDLIIDFFVTIDDAEANTNAISVSERTAFNATTQTVYIRVGSTISDCYKVVPLDIVINTLPIFLDISMLQVCEDDTDKTEAFILSVKDSEILNGQIGKEVYYFENESDALNGNNAIDKNNDYFNISPTQTIYVRVENITDTTCFGISSFTIRVSSNPIYNTAFEDYFQCDDRSNDEKFTFNLNEKINEIKQGSPAPNNLNVTFHLTSIDAQTGESALPLQYTNATNPQTLYVRIQSTDTQCLVFDELGINIVPAPNLTDANPLEVCDTYTDRLDGIAIFNLDNADYQNLDRIQTITVHYYENFDDINQDDALDNTLAIANPTNYVSGSKTVYIKVTNTITNCFTIIPLDLIVNSPPAFNIIGTIEICDNDTNTYDLSQVDSMLLTDPSMANISYHNSSDDAVNNNAPIGNTFNYTSSNHLIFVRISDINTGCFITTSFNLQINPNPIANSAPDLTACDDDYDGLFAFDLSQNDDDIVGTQNPVTYTVTYYSNLVNAVTGTNELNNPHPAVEGDLIYARLENNSTGCYDITQFTVHVNALPVVPVSDVIHLCVNDLPLIIDAYTGNPNDTYLWSTGETTPQIALGLGDAGDDYWITVTRSYANALPCEFTQPFSVIESAIADINFTTTVNFADPNSITVDVSGIGDYVYILDDGEPQDSNVFNNVTLGTHTVTVKDVNGCEDISQEVTVFDIPKFVTPNNDGYFDTWHVVDNKQLPGTIVYIYDRYGKLLKTLPSNSPGWDGTYNGYNMPADDYWFVANIVQQGNAFTIKGHFALKR